MKQSLLFLALISTVAAAQVPQQDLEQVWLDPSARGSLWVGNGTTLKQAEFRVGVAMTYSYGQFRTAQSGAVYPLLSDRLGMQIFGAVGILDWLEVGANVPVYFYQRGDELNVRGGAGLGNPWLHLKAQILDGKKPVSLAIDLGVGIPVGVPNTAQVNAGISAKGLEFAPKVQLGKVFQNWQFGAEVGFLYKSAADYSAITFTPTGNASGDFVGSQVWMGLMAATVNQSGPRGEFSVRGFVPVGVRARPGIEAQLGVRVPVGPVEFFASAGPGFGGAPQTPFARVYAGIAFGNAKLPQPPCVEGSPYETADCPDLDKDGDGIANKSDKAPLDPEDKDGFEDEDGAPEADNDGDGVPDGEDKCRDVAGVKANNGCPDPDTDGDGIVDRLDKAPNEPEDKDGFEDEDGAPDLDNDKDSFLDKDDLCPDVAGILREKGCPAKDDDADGVANHEDNCPTEAGTKENYGCPAAQKQLVVIQEKKITILDKVYFDTGKATIQARSNGLLDNLVRVLSTHPGIEKVQIEGHTDSSGNADKNKKLSQDRADAVRAYLVKGGVADARLIAIGFGAEKPIADNKTAKGREANRRVEFNIP